MRIVFGVWEEQEAAGKEVQIAIIPSAFLKIW